VCSPSFHPSATSLLVTGDGETPGFVFESLKFEVSHFAKRKESFLVAKCETEKTHKTFRKEMSDSLLIVTKYMTMTMKIMKSLLLFCLVGAARGIPEAERAEQFNLRNYSWPHTDFIPNTPGWKALMEHRLRQVAEIENSSDRYEGFAQTLSAGMLQQNYTEHGFGLVRAPEDLMEALRAGIHDGLAQGPREEVDISAINGERPWFIDRPDLTQRVRKRSIFYLFFPSSISNRILSFCHVIGSR
jgi:hypothetical protein